MFFWRFSGIFCPWTSYRSHILTQEQFFLKIWSLEMYKKISYEILIFDHIWGGGWPMNIYCRRLLRPERSSAARRCACFPSFLFPSLFFLSLSFSLVFFLFFLDLKIIGRGEQLPPASPLARPWLKQIHTHIHSYTYTSHSMKTEEINWLFILMFCVNSTGLEVK